MRSTSAARRKARTTTYAAATSGKSAFAWLYVFENPTTRLLKVGFTTNGYGERMKSLECASGCALSVRWAIYLPLAQAQAHEDRLHAHLREFRARGEWFSFDAIRELDLAIGQLCGAVRPDVAPRGVRVGAPVSSPKRAMCSALTAAARPCRRSARADGVCDQHARLRSREAS